jgi:hypothetical protein
MNLSEKTTMIKKAMDRLHARKDTRQVNPNHSKQDINQFLGTIQNKNPELDFSRLYETTGLEDFSKHEAGKPFFDALITLLGIIFKRERNQLNQSQIYKLILVKLFSHDLNLLERAAKELGFWFKNKGNGKAILAWELSKADIKKYNMSTKDITKAEGKDCNEKNCSC